MIFLGVLEQDGVVCSGGTWERMKLTCTKKK